MMKKTLLVTIAVFVFSIGTGIAELERYAIAKIDASYGSALMTLSEKEGTGLLLKGSPDLTILNGGPLDINSSGDAALQIQGKPRIGLDRLNVVGGITTKGKDDPSMWEATEINTYLGSEHVSPDPYVDVPDAVFDPSIDEGAADPNAGDEWVLSPGYYSGGFIIEDANVILLPGNYYLDGGADATGGLILNGGAFVTGERVTLHIVGTGEVSIGQNAKLDVSAPDDGFFKGITMYQSRFNTNEATFRGATYCGGAMYMPKNDVEITGYVHCERLISYTAKLSGKGELVINYIGERYPADRSYLVE